MIKYKNLFEPICIGKAWIKNRIAMAPMNNGHQMDSTQGTITQRCVDYYVERAKGGVGLIITGVFKVENDIERCIKNDIVQWPLLTEKSLPEYIELADYVHSYGGKIFVQLSAGPGRVTSAKVINSGIKPVSASPNQAYWIPEVICRALTIEEVGEIVKAFGRAAEIVVKAGMDGIEVHGHEGYLIDQFTTSLWNRRTDKYGGDLKGRLTFPIEILREIKDKTGGNFPIIYRYGIKHFIEESWKASLHGEREMGRDLPESIEMAKLLEKAGYDALDIDTGCYEGNYFAHPPCYQPHGFSIDLVKEVKKAVKIPILAANRLDIPTLAEEVLKQGKADVIVLGRALLADAYWPKKVREGRIEDIRPCIGCQEGCLRRPSGLGASTSCSVNPTCGREKSYALTSTSKQKKVVVVGGGVAGMEAARIATIKGHHVILYEKTAKLGGHLIEASVPEFKKDIERLLDWYKMQMTKLKIEIRYEKLVTPELIRKEEVNTAIIATGSTPLIPEEIPGVSKSMVVTCCDLYLDTKKAGNNIVIIGGGLEGCETALWLTKQGKTVTVIEKLSNVIADTFFANRFMLLDLLADNKVQIMVNTSVQEITSGSIIAVNRNFERSKINCDTVVLAVGMKPNQELYNSLAAEIANLYLIGDCKKPRKIHDAIFEGYSVGHAI